ncbi:hypothetical protein C8J57DRAFT_1395958 [Mycena rebaudengoi]|nr:hypothetical protein C8J57DRAFT_1395958 [Mycena rebaudengoi]
MVVPSEATSSKSSPSHVRSRIYELDTRILALQASLAAAHREREDLQSRLNDYTYPILTLPVEITSEIFIHTLPVYPARPPLTGTRSPTLLSQICRRWRDIAFGTPRLWRAIQLDITRETHLEKQLCVLTTWLSRSKDFPLSISLDYECEAELCDSELPDFTDAPISSATRWEYIHLIIPFHNLDWIRGPFPLLCDLAIGRSNYAYDELEIPAASPFHDAPRLQKVHLCVLFDASHAFLPWWQFTSISFERCEPSVLANILPHAVSLQDFDGTLWDEDEDVPVAHIHPVTQPIHIRSLILRDEGSTTGAPQKLLLDALTTPALRHLMVSEHELGIGCLSTIASFITRSHCTLESLNVTNADRSHEADYRAAFPSISNIQVLRAGEMMTSDYQTLAV